MKSKSETLDVYFPHWKYADLKVLYFVEVLFQQHHRNEPSVINIIHRRAEYQKVLEGDDLADLKTRWEPFQARSTVYQYSFLKSRLPPGTLEEVRIYQGDFRQKGFRYSDNLLKEYSAPYFGEKIKHRAQSIVISLKGKIRQELRRNLKLKEKERRERVLGALEKIVLKKDNCIKWK